MILLYRIPALRILFLSALFLLQGAKGYTQKVNQIVAQLDTTQNDSLKSNLYAKLSRHYSRINLDTCKMYADSVGMIGRKTNNEALLKRIDYYYAVCELNAGNYDVALELLNKVTPYYERQKDSVEMATMLYQKMVCHYFKRDQSNFLSTANQGIRIQKKLGNEKMIARIINLKSSFYKNLQSYDKAIALAKEALQIYESYDDSLGIAAVCNNMGDMYTLSGRPEAAVPYFQRQHAINSSLGYEWGLGYSHGNLGAVYLQQGDLDQAEYHIKAAMAISLKIKGKMELAGAYMQLAELYLKRRQFAQAADYAKEGLNISELSKNGKQQKVAAQLLSQIYEEQGDFKKSLTYFKKYEAEKDTMLNETISQQILEIETAYETKEKEEEIAMLSHRSEIDQLKINQQRVVLSGLAIVLAILSFLVYRIFNQKKKIESQNQIISKALQEKDILLREIHHRVKNNLQLVSSLLGLQSHHVQDPNALQVLNSGKSRVKSMALIHQNLYHKENLTGVSLREYVEKLSSELMHSFKIDNQRIQLHTSIPDMLLDVDTLVPLGLIINELLTNTLKYAFPDGRSGSIHIHLFESENQLFLDFSDDGVGMDLDNRRSESFGLKLIDTLLDQLEGEMEVEVDQGTKLSFKFSEYKIAA